MNCKFCNAELEDGVTLCPQCGKENMEEVSEEVVEEVTQEVAQEITEETDSEENLEEIPEETPKKKTSLWVTILAIIGGVALLAVLAGAIYFGFINGKTPAVKTESYTVSAAKAEKERDTVVATTGNHELTNSALQVYYWQGVNEFYNYYSYYMDPSTMGLDLTLPMDQQFYDEANGITWQQYFLQSALDVWHRYAALAQMAEEEGFALSAETQAYIDTIPAELEAMSVNYGYADAADMLYQDMGAACDVDGYMDFIKLNYFVNEYYTYLYEKLTPTMEEMETYYAENEASLNEVGIVNDGSMYVDVRHVLVKPAGTLDSETGEMVYSEEDWEACRQKAQDLLDQWQAGEATEESFAQMAVEHSEDAGSQSLGGLYTDVNKGRMVEPFDNWCFDESRVYGDTGLVQTTYGYHIMFFVESREAWASNLQTQMITERSTVAVEEAVAKYPMDVDMKKVVLSETTSTEE